MADVKINFEGCNVTIGKMFDIHDNNNVVINNGNKQNEDKPSVESPSKRGGRKPKELFIDEDTKNREKQRFLDYLKLHNMSNKQLTSSKNDTLNDIVTCFLIEWRQRNLLIDDFSSGAIFRFLTTDCRLSSSVEERAYGNMIRDRIKKKEYETSTLQLVYTAFK